MSFFRKAFACLMKKIGRIVLPYWQPVMEGVGGSYKNQQQNLFENIPYAGKNLTIGERVRISPGFGTIIGNNVVIGDNTVIASRGGMVIGAGTTIGNGCRIYTTSPVAKESRKHPYWSPIIVDPVLIGRNVTIGDEATILSGTCIEDEAVIDSGTRIREWRETSGKEEQTAGPSFFILSTGRSGTHALADLLNRHPNCRCIHESHPQFVRLSSELGAGIRPPEKVAREIQYIYRECIPSSEVVYGESNQKFFNLVEILAELYPRAKFIWLVRDGRSVVASSHSRGWFSNAEKEKGTPYPTGEPGVKPWKFWRTDGYAFGEFSRDEWNRMSQFEKNCWYWSFVNKIIEKQLSQLAPDRWRMVRLEFLDQHLLEILELLSLQRIGLPVRKTNQAKNYIVYRPDKWSQHEIDVFEKWCLTSMNKLYPGWKA